MKLHIKNWRSIEEVEIELKPVTIIMGPNDAGKSSLAYAPYFLTKTIKWRDANKVLKLLYGTELNNIARHEYDKPQYPVIIEVDGARFKAQNPNDVKKADIEIAGESPWNDGYLLPSGRLTFMKMLRIVPRILRQITRTRDYSAFPPPMYLFLDDLVRIHGIGPLLLEHELTEYTDPFAKAKLPLNLAPDGTTDHSLINLFINNVQEGSLLIIEEPEIHKNPTLVIELTRQITQEAINKKLTIIITTHSDIIPQTIAKTVEEGKTKPNNVAIYYLERKPWTQARELKIHEDGTIEELPDVEKIITELF
ncbi:AAA family ATPase [Caldivirga maquilingensis]|uniref:Endonuclease GajA/Old nuclease/RecF-like AAA domain-containing protein n=1 Tax=Caldivirga maquilingensis (strain ATCC 700844 / DSM 13496 / JCM 10307 / IC-167) TaxID=397948 RepID=A8M947_CALMQ|nr:AAA family ATPase [Caldivirga maquilingensis]ABW02266.1 conserved hypothetical protein [Caldivirga maquilingensis IC-167]